MVSDGCTKVRKESSQALKSAFKNGLRCTSRMAEIKGSLEKTGSTENTVLAAAVTGRKPITQLLRK